VLGRRGELAELVPDAHGHRHLGLAAAQFTCRSEKHAMQS
jgi:hypothetical protein